MTANIQDLLDQTHLEHTGLIWITNLNGPEDTPDFFEAVNYFLDGSLSVQPKTILSEATSINLFETKNFNQKFYILHINQNTFKPENLKKNSKILTEKLGLGRVLVVTEGDEKSFSKLGLGSFLKKNHLDFLK